MFSLRSVHALLDVGGKVVERLLDVDVVLGGNLQEWDTEFVGKLLALFDGDGPLFLPVALVSN